MLATADATALQQAATAEIVVASTAKYGQYPRRIDAQVGHLALSASEFARRRHRLLRPR
jgi:hypothetical protein